MVVQIGKERMTDLPRGGVQDRRRATSRWNSNPIGDCAASAGLSHASVSCASFSRYPRQGQPR